MAPPPTRQPIILMVCKPFSTSKMRQTSCSPPSSASLAGRQVVIRRLSIRFGICSSGFSRDAAHRRTDVSCCFVQWVTWHPAQMPSGGITMSTIQAQRIHHITLVGSNRETTIDFYQTVLGMPLVIDQPKLDVPGETHPYL